MAINTVESVASFTVVLAETFAAVGLATVAPAATVALAKALKGQAAGTGPSPAPAIPPLAGQDKTELIESFSSFPGPTKKVAEFMGKAFLNLDELHLMVPKTAKIHAEFEFQGSETWSGNGTLALGPSVTQIVSINAGFSALYSSTSKNKITLDVDFELAKFPI